jgi:hypothetical protein
MKEGSRAPHVNIDGLAICELAAHEANRRTLDTVLGEQVRPGRLMPIIAEAALTSAMISESGCACASTGNLRGELRPLARARSQGSAATAA